jgi:hypothetical protein
MYCFTYKNRSCLRMTGMVEIPLCVSPETCWDNPRGSFYAIAISYLAALRHSPVEIW